MAGLCRPLVRGGFLLTIGKGLSCQGTGFDLNAEKVTPADTWTVEGVRRLLQW